MKFTAHIGLGKTGTSAIQKSLQSYKGSLNTSENWGWPELANGKTADGKWFDLPHSTEKTKALYDTIVAHSKKTGCNHIIWSNEAIAGHKPMLNLFKQLRGWDKDLEVKIIIYVRGPGKWLKSAWDQWGLVHKVLPSKPLKVPPRAGKWNGHHPVSFDDWFWLWGRDQYFAYLKWKPIADLRLYQEGENVIDDFSSVIGIDLPRVRAYETRTSAEVFSRAVYNNTYTETVSTQKFDLYERYFKNGGINEYAKRFFALPNIKQKIQILLKNPKGALFEDPEIPKERTLTSEDYSRLLDQAIVFSIEAIGRIDQLEDKVKELSNKLDDSP